MRTIRGAAVRSSILRESGGLLWRGTANFSVSTEKRTREVTLLLASRRQSAP